MIFWMWFILIILSVLNIVWIFYQYVNNDDHFGTSLLMAVLLFLVGWVLIGSGKTVNEEIEKVDNIEIEIVKTKYYVLVIYDATIYKYEEQEDFNDVSDSTQFYYYKGINMYGTHSFDSDLFYINNNTEKKRRRTMIEFFSILTIISILVLNLGLIKDKGNVKDTGVVMLVLVILIGWLLIGMFAQVNDTDYKTNIICEKNDNEIVVQDSLDNKYIFNKKLDFDHISDTTTFYITVSKNIYGFYPHYEIFYKVGDRKMKGIEE